MELQSPPFKQCVVAVGSTEFTHLIERLDCNQFYRLLSQNGFTDLLF